MLDPHGRAEVIRTIRELNCTRKMTVVLITHYMDEAVQADRVVVMDDGRVVMDGTPKQVFSQVPRLRELGLDVPQVTQLCWELRQAGVDIPADVLGVEECAELLMNLLKRRKRR